MFNKRVTSISLAVLLAVMFAVSAAAGDLYQVTLRSAADAALLGDMGVDPIHGGDNVYVVLADSASAVLLESSGLDAKLLVRGISRDQLAIDSRPDSANVQQFELLFEQGDYRLYRVDPTVFSATTEAPPVFPLLSIRPRITYRELPSLERIMPTEIVGGLDTIIAKVNQDSLRSYVLGLQSFQQRVAGTASNYASRDWIENKLRSFGYDSVLTDSFYAYVYGGYLPCQNVVAYKLGTKYPDYHLIVGAHRDAVPGSPGADDNGSGTAAVMEFARVLRNVNTDLTIVFCLFDAEESGLLGAEHYVGDAIIEGEDIAFMFNMDMIANYQNSYQANVHYADDDTYARLWIQLADSLVGLQGYLAGPSSGSDHYPFGLAGYPVAYAAEYYFSPVYHSYRDSTTYMSFPYMTKMVKASLATVYQVNTMLKPQPAIGFTHPVSFPSLVTPGYPTPLEVEIKSINYGEIVPGSATLYYSVGGSSFVAESMTDLGGSLFRAVLPAASCYNTLRYYITAEEAQTGLFYDGSAEHPYWATVATDYSATFSDDFDTDKSWSSTWEGAWDGFWERGIPINDPYSPWDPITDASGPGGMCFVTGNGSGEDVDEGIVRLWSPRFDLPQDASISYDYYLSLSQEDGIDQMVVEITPEYGVVPWMTIAVHNTSGDGFWRHNVISWQELEAAGMTPSGHARIRFAVNDDYPESTVEAGIDNFSVGNFDCQIVQCCGAFTGGYTGNTDCDTEGKTNLADITALIDRIYLSKLPLCCEQNGNVDGDPENVMNLSDITALVDHIYLSKNPTAVCQ